MMNGSRMTIVGMMGVVVLAAADCAALRWLCVPGNRSALLVLGLLPLLDLLCVGGVLGARDLIVKRSCRSSLVGIQVFGWLVAGAYAIGCMSASAFDVVEAYFRVVLGPVTLLIDRLGGVYDDSSVAWRMFSYSCSSVALSTPLVACALAGGWIARRFEIWLARGTWLLPDERHPAKVV